MDIEHRNIFQKYIGKYDFCTYEYSFLTLYIWRKMLNTEFAVIDDALIIKKYCKKVGTYFMQPIGYKKEDLVGIVHKLNKIRENSADFKSLFRDVETSFLYELLDMFEGNICLCEDINNFDYIYSSKDLISLSGKKFHRKKNQYNQFISSYDYKIKDLLEDGVIKDCIDFAHSWYENRKGEDEQLMYELDSIRDILPKYQILGIKGMAVYVSGKMAGFTIGEKVNSNMAVIHIEKGDLEYDGIYAFINKTFAENYFSDVKYINRQEDLGIEGLRKAKRGYNPVKLEKKFAVDLYS